MIIYLNDDKPYLHWVAHHKQGFVLAGQREPKLGHFTLHRATCVEVKGSSTKRTHLTTGSRLKACSLEAGELKQWCLDAQSKAPAICAVCAPLDAATAPPDERHVTKFGREILDYVLEAAAIHFEEDSPPYRLSVADIAACLGKGTSGTAQSLRGLVEQGLICVRSRSGRGRAITPRSLVFPTIAAIRALDAYAEESDEFIGCELEKLAPQH